MDCIPYINDLKIEINMLNDLKINGNDVEKIDKQIEEKQKLIDKCKNNLSKLSKNNIEYRLYLKILEGSNITKAIREIADENYKNDIKPTSETAIYKYYYPKLKKIINV